MDVDVFTTIEKFIKLFCSKFKYDVKLNSLKLSQ